MTREDWEWIQKKRSNAKAIEDLLVIERVKLKDQKDAVKELEEQLDQATAALNAAIDEATGETPTLFSPAVKEIAVKIPGVEEVTIEQKGGEN